MKPQKKAILAIHLYVDCPQCLNTIDLFDETDTSGYDHNEEGYLIKNACPSTGFWVDSHEVFKCENVKCSYCGIVFDVNGICW